MKILLRTAQVLPRLSLMKPFSPQAVPQEFLTSHETPSYPKAKTAWLVPPAAQLLKTPPVYLDQLVASTETVTGLS